MDKGGLQGVDWGLMEGMGLDAAPWERWGAGAGEGVNRGSSRSRGMRVTWAEIW